MVQPPSVEETIEILMGLKAKYEEHHKCIYTARGYSKRQLFLSDRYIHGRFCQIRQSILSMKPAPKCAFR